MVFGLGSDGGGNFTSVMKDRFHASSVPRSRERAQERSSGNNDDWPEGTSVFLSLRTAFQREGRRSLCGGRLLVTVLLGAALFLGELLLVLTGRGGKQLGTHCG